MPVTSQQTVANGANGLEITEPNALVGVTIAGVFDVVPATKMRIDLIEVEQQDDAEAWIHVYDAALADVTPGTTEWAWQRHIPASSTSAVPQLLPLTLFVTAPFCVMVSSMEDGSGDPSTGAIVTVQYDHA